MALPTSFIPDTVAAPQSTPTPFLTSQKSGTPSVPKSFVADQPHPGIIQSLAQGVAHPFLEGISSIGSIGNNVVGAADRLLGKTGAADARTAAAKKIDSEGADYGWLGKAKPIGAGFDIMKPVSENIKPLLNAAGTGAEIASYLVPAGGAEEAGMNLLKGKIWPAIKGGAKVGAQYGGLQGFGQGLQDENPSVGGVVKSTLLGTAGGAITGGAFGGAGATGMKVLGGGANVARNLFLPAEEKILNHRMTTLSALEDGNKAVRNISRDAQAKGINLKDIVANTDLLHGSVDEAGNVSTTRPGEAVSQVYDFLKPNESVVSNAIAKEGNTISLAKVRQQLISDVNSSGVAGGSKITALQKVERELQGLAMDADAQGNIPIAKIQDAKITKARNLNYMDKESMNTDKAIASVYKTIVENNSSAKVKALNAELGKYYSLIDYLEALDGKKVKGGKMGKYFAQTTGAIAGSHFGPLGSIVGSELAGKIKGINLAGTFGDELGGKLNMSDLMKNTVADNARPNDFPQLPSGPIIAPSGPDASGTNAARLKEVTDYYNNLIRENTPKLPAPQGDAMPTGKQTIPLLPETESTIANRERALHQSSNGVGNPNPTQTANSILNKNPIPPDSTMNGSKGQASLKAILGVGGLSAGTAALSTPSVSNYTAPKLPDSMTIPAKTEAPIDVDKLMTSIRYNESRGEKNPYSFSQSSGSTTQGRALGAYQITEGELKTYAPKYLGKPVTPEQFLKSSKLQDDYMRAKIKSLEARGLPPEDILGVHNKGGSDLTPEGLSATRKKAAGYIKSGMDQYAGAGTRSFQGLSAK